MTEETMERIERIKAMKEEYDKFSERVREIYKLSDALFYAIYNYEDIKAYIKDTKWVEDCEFARSNLAPEDLESLLIEKESFELHDFEYYEVLVEIGYMANNHRKVLAGLPEER